MRGKIDKAHITLGVSQPTVEVGDRLLVTAVTMTNAEDGGWDELAEVVVQPDSLDAALAETEAALPEGWIFKRLERAQDVYARWVGGWGANAGPIVKMKGVGAWGFGPTPVAALRALAAKLRNPED